MTKDVLIRINQSGVARVEVDGKQIGLIQSLQLSLNKDSALPELKVQFPELPEDSDSPVKDSLKEYIDIMKSIPYCKVD
jgi:hypothetical protein